MNKSIISALFLFLISVLISGFLLKIPHIANSQQAPLTNYSQDEIIVKYKPFTTEPEKEALRAKTKSILKNKIHQLNIDVIKIQGDIVDKKIKEFRSSTSVAYAEPNFKAQALGITNDTALSQQWGLFKINAANNTGYGAWDITTSSASIKIAVLDTGIETTHPDLSGKIITSSNFTNSPTASDLNGHGTHVAGIAAATTNNGIGIAGTGYNTSILNGKVLDDNGSGYYSWAINGIIWAADQGAQVINLSLGGTSSSIALEDAINYAWSKGSVVVAAAGNSGNSSPLYPGYYQNVLAVAATNSNDMRANFSTYGNWVDVAAPGDSIYSTYKGNSYAIMSGTSMATPFASGALALIWAQGSCATNVCVRSRLEQSADQISGTGTYWTWGRINAYKAISSNIPTPTNAPPPTFTPTPQPTDTTKPTVYITYPTKGSTVPAKTNITATAIADDNLIVTKVVFLRNNAAVCTITTPAPDKNYSCSMYTGNAGKNIQYKARAYDAAGNNTTSTVTVMAK